MADDTSNPAGGAWQQPRTFPWLPLLVGVVLLAGVAYYFLAMRSGAPPGAVATLVTAQSGRLTYENDDGGNLPSVSRQDRKELWYRVDLDHAPIGSTLTLDCDWIDPSGKVAHHNHYPTKEIDKSVWPTHARYLLPADAPAGTWTVKLSLDGRVLNTLKFEVKTIFTGPKEIE
jgi:hypothetical protein